MADSIKIMDNRGSVATRVIASNKTTALTSTLVVIAAILAAFASSVAVIYTRPTHVMHADSVEAHVAALPEHGLKQHVTQILARRHSKGVRL